MTAFEAFNEGARLSMDEEHARALAAFETAIGLDPTHHGAIAGKAMSLASLGRPEEAIVFFKQAINLEPDFAEYFRQLGLTYLEVGDTERAGIAIRGAVELDPSAEYRRNAAIETYNFGGQIMIRAAHLRDAGERAAELQSYRCGLFAFTLAAELDPRLKAAQDAIERVQNIIATRS